MILSEIQHFPQQWYVPDYGRNDSTEKFWNNITYLYKQEPGYWENIYFNDTNLFILSNGQTPLKYLFGKVLYCSICSGIFTLTLCIIALLALYCKCKQKWVLTVMLKDRNHACTALNQNGIGNISVTPKFMETSSQSHTENIDVQSLNWIVNRRLEI